MTTLTSTEFKQGALWAINVLMNTTRDTDSAYEILSVFPDLLEFAKQVPEKDLSSIREFVVNGLPLGTDHGFLRVAYGAMGVGETIIELPESGDVDDLAAAPGDVLYWVVYGVKADGEKVALIQALSLPEEAEKLASKLAEQLA
ncbi:MULTISPECIES: hypothetical protein [Morganellaceae]|uniref:Uncharacterized protein n=2 Tax=Moellerella wisconsensis TaxID=158849 RepID=A0A9Q8V691_9GAMM|nr:MULTISPECIES: hypothetical protein [Morganellaceae]UNH32511.1 hypothetical protein MNY72_17465 [Moellerella wisconsensis]UNH40827.1 hypothetical protein MNY70_16600 [Moellerella wisconsensis]UNH44083.1 hypothetical protein MNY66_17165 [Moellerella wisconsensis]